MINPVLRREIKTSMRSWKTSFAITIYLAILLLAVGIFIYSTQLDINSMGFSVDDSIGFYALIAMLQLAFIIFISPALTASSISGERERQTLELMLITKMSTLSIVIGKLLSSIGIVLIMIFTSLPIFALVLNYGGISLFNLLTIFSFFIVVACTMGSVGIFFSTVFKKTSIATVMSYIFICIICGLNFILYIVFWQLTRYTDSGTIPNIFDIIFGLGTNPIIGFISIIEKQLGADYLGFLFNTRIYYSGMSTPTTNTIYNLQPWIGIINIAINIFISIIFLLLSARNIKLTKKLVIKKIRR